MNNVYSIFTKKLLEPNELIVTKPPKDYQIDVILDRSGVFDRIRAGFEDKLPNHFETCMTIPQKQPYMHGDVSNVIYRKKRQKHFNNPFPVPSLITVESVLKRNGIIQLGYKCEYGIDEPFPWMDNKYQISLNFLKSLPNGTEIHINTRSDLIATDAYLDELRRLKPTINILYCSENYEINRRIEPGAPSYKRRLEATIKLNQWNCNAQMVLHEIPEKYRHYLNKSA